MEENEKKYPQGHFVGMWIAIGMVIFSGVGIPLSVSTGNNALIGIGPVVGMIIGMAIGKSIEAKHEREGNIRPLTKKENKTRNIWLISLLALGILALAVIAAIVF